MRKQKAKEKQKEMEELQVNKDVKALMWTFMNNSIFL
jgi:hypothetical protein